MGSIPVRDSDFSLPHDRVMLISSFSTCRNINYVCTTFIFAVSICSQHFLLLNIQWNKVSNHSHLISHRESDFQRSPPSCLFSASSLARPFCDLHKAAPASHWLASIPLSYSTSVQLMRSTCGKSRSQWQVASLRVLFHSKTPPKLQKI